MNNRLLRSGHVRLPSLLQHAAKFVDILLLIRGQMLKCSSSLAERTTNQLLFKLIQLLAYIWARLVESSNELTDLI